MPSIPGLAETPVLTPDTWLDLELPPQKLAIFGRSPDAIALAQGAGPDGNQNYANQPRGATAAHRRP